MAVLVLEFMNENTTSTSDSILMTNNQIFDVQRIGRMTHTLPEQSEMVDSEGFAVTIREEESD